MKKETVSSHSPPRAESRCPWAWHPFLLALFPLCSLYASNVAEIPLATLARPALILVLAVGMLWLALRVALKNDLKAAFVVSAWVILFFGYGLVLGAVRASAWADVLGRNRFYMVLWLIAFGLTTFLILRNRRDLRVPTSLLNAFSAACLLVALVQGALGWARFERAGSSSAPGGLRPVAAPDAPDIYYIILDAYGRADTLRQFYDFDNRPFVDELQKRGFFVANRSQSNYSHTVFSLSSSFDMNYHDAAWARRMGNSTDFGPLFQKIRRSEVVSFLQNRGYQTVHVTSGSSWLNARDGRIVRAKVSLEGIEQLLFSLTFFQQIPQAANSRYDNRRRLISYALDQLPVVAGQKSKAPRFVFAHILAPHPPFVWNARGEPFNANHPYYESDSPLGTTPQAREEYRRGYVGQLQAINVRVLRALDGIRANSRVPPVIVLQGDHGPNLGQEGKPSSYFALRMSILNAFYLPPGASSTKPPGANARPYPSISPVNNLRVVFNRTFGTNYPLLSDRSYHSEWLQPYKFVDVTEKPARRAGN